MINSTFDATGYLRFNLEKGTIQSPNNEQLALLPIELISNLAPDDNLLKASRKWGKVHGKRLADSMSKSNEPAGIELLAQYLNGTLAVVGLGQMSLEIRSDALLFKVEKNTHSGTSNQNESMKPALKIIISGFLAGYLSVLIPNYFFDAIFFAAQRDSSLFFAGNPSAIKKIKQWFKVGKNPTEILELLAKESN